MQLIATFARLVDRISTGMTAPSQANFRTVLTGWLFTARRTLTGCVISAGATLTKSISTLCRLFSKAPWSLDRMGLCVHDMAVERQAPDQAVDLVVDDTRSNKRGKKIFGSGMYYDPLVSTKSMKIMTWGLCWVVLGVVVRFPFAPERTFVLPFLFRLYLTHAAAQRWRRAYKSKPQLALEMLRWLRRERPSKSYHVIADETYGGHQMLRGLPPSIDLTSRLTLPAGLYEPPRPRQPGRAGRPPVRGPKIGSPETLLATKGLGTICTLEMYGRHDKVRLIELEARVREAPEVPLKIVLEEPKQGGRPLQAFFSTKTSLDAQGVVSKVASRWGIEESNRGGKSLLGFEQPQSWTCLAVRRTAPVAMLLYSLILLWFAEEGHRLYQPVERPWYKSKRRPSFADALTTLRLACLKQTVFEGGLSPQGLVETLSPLVLAS